MPFASRFHNNSGEREGIPSERTTNAEILAKRIKDLQIYGIENVWIRLNEVLESECDASVVLGFGKSELRGMMISMKVLQNECYYVDNLRKALGPHKIGVGSTSYKITIGNSCLDLKNVRFSFLDSFRSEEIESQQPNANLSSLCEFWRLKYEASQAEKMDENGDELDDAVPGISPNPLTQDLGCESQSNLPHICFNQGCEA
jgi:hypothetical protein